MSTEFTLEEVLNFLEAEEQSSEYTEQNTAKLEKEAISEPPKTQTQEDEEDVTETEEQNTEDESSSANTDDTDSEEGGEPIPDEDEDSEIPKAYYEFLKNNNVLFLEDDYEFDGTAAGLETALVKTRENLAAQAINALWSKLNPDFQAALKYNLDGGTDFSKFASTYGTSTDYSDYDLSKIDDQKAIVAKYYKETSNYSDERINKFINKLIETEDLYDEAEEAKDYLKKLTEKRKADLLEQTEKERAARESQIEEWRKTVINTVDSSDIPKSRKSKVQSFLLNPVQREGAVSTDFERTLTAIFQNPQHYVQLADLLYNYDTKKGLDLTRFVDKNKTQATSKFQKELEEAMKSGGKLKGGTVQKPIANTTLDWENILNQLDN